jgi:2-isopropylmalate synthase
VAAFLGTSPIRRYTEGWNGDFLLQTTEKAVQYAVSLGLEVMYVTEDTTRCDPESGSSGLLNRHFTEGSPRPCVLRPPAGRDSAPGSP